MKTLECKLCHKNMGEVEKGKVRYNAVILCIECWDRADAAIQMAEFALKPDSDTKSNTPDFIKDLFGKFRK